MELTIKVMYEQWQKLWERADLSGNKALEAVKADGDALSYVKEQTAEICLEAVKAGGDALRYVKEHVFSAKIKLKA